MPAAAERTGASHFTADHHENGEQKAERMVMEEMKRPGCQNDELQRRCEGDMGKVAVARWLGRETTMSLKRIARRPMGGWTHVPNLLNERPRH